MDKNNILAFIVFTAVLAASANAAVIKGTVYDLNLEKKYDAIVEISTSPKQQYVAKNGSYSFGVQTGEYTLSAERYESGILVSSVEENILVKDEGKYIIDLILFPSISEEEELMEQADFDIESEILGGEEDPFVNAVIIITVLLVLGILWIGSQSIKKRREDHEKDIKNQEIRDVLVFIRKKGGRTTQKEIRKNFPQSEAKISLILTELEEDKKIKKIKKGRGNVIILT